MAKTVFTDGDKSTGVPGTRVLAAWLNKVFSHKHDGLDQDGSASIEYGYAGAAAGSSSSCDIWAADGNIRHITGTITINDFATAPQAGARMKCIADAAFTLVHSATMDLPGQNNIVCAVGDAFEVFAETTTTFKVRNFTRQDGSAIKILNSSITGDKISKNITLQSSTNLAAGAAWIPPQGVYQVIAVNITLQIYISGAWYGAGISTTMGIIYCDGSNMKLYNESGSNQSLNYQKF